MDHLKKYLTLQDIFKYNQSGKIILEYKHCKNIKIGLLIPWYVGTEDSFRNYWRIYVIKGKKIDRGSREITLEEALYFYKKFPEIFTPDAVVRMYKFIELYDPLVFSKLAARRTKAWECYKQSRKT